MSWVALGTTAVSAGMKYYQSKKAAKGGGGLQDIRSEEQKQAQGALQNLAMTGEGAGIKLGEQYEGSFGDFGTTNIEKGALEQIEGYSPNQALSGAESTFGQLANMAFDPSGMEPYRKAAIREEGAALDRLKQAKAATGSRFGTGFGRDASSLIEGTTLGLQQRLADLFEGSKDRALQAGQGLADTGRIQAGVERGQIADKFAYGGRERELANQKAQAEFNDWNRARGETLKRIDLLKGEANRNPYVGVSEAPQSKSAWSGLIDGALTAAGNKYGASGGTSGAISTAMGKIGTGFSNWKAGRGAGSFVGRPQQGPLLPSGKFK